jgi:hypothetical protein
LRCITILTLTELIAALTKPGLGAALAPSPEQLAALRAYRLKYGIATAGGRT